MRSAAPVQAAVSDPRRIHRYRTEKTQLLKAALKPVALYFMAAAFLLGNQVVTKQLPCQPKYFLVLCSLWNQHHHLGKYCLCAKSVEVCISGFQRTIDTSLT